MHGFDSSWQFINSISALPNNNILTDHACAYFVVNFISLNLSGKGLFNQWSNSFSINHSGLFLCESISVVNYLLCHVTWESRAHVCSQVGNI